MASRKEQRLARQRQAATGRPYLACLGEVHDELAAARGDAEVVSLEAARAEPAPTGNGQD